MRYLLLYLVLFFCLSIYGQNEKIILVKYENKNCAKSDELIKKEIKKFSDIELADAYLRNICQLTNNSVYKLYCSGCKGRTIIDFPEINNSKIKHKGAYTLSTKGDIKINNLLQFRNLLLDSLTIMDELIFDISNMSEGDSKKAQTLYFLNQETNEKFYPKFDIKQKKFTIDKSVFLSVKDNVVTVKTFYLDGKNVKVLPNNFRLEFISDSIKISLKDDIRFIYDYDRSIFDDSTGLEYVLTDLSKNYSDIDVESVERWLNTVIQKNE